MSVVTKAALKAKFETGDFPTQQDFIDFIDTVYPYEKYVAILNQTGTNAPVATVLENSLGGTVVWTRIIDGGTGHKIYKATLAGVFTSAKTQIYISNQYDASTGNTTEINQQWNDVNSIYIFTANTDGRLSNTPIEIRVYP